MLGPHEAKGPHPDMTMTPKTTPPGGTHETDVVIIGAGPCGLFAVFECGMLKMQCHVIDVLEAPGGQCVALYPEKPIFDIPAWPRIDAAELIDKLVEQAAPFSPAYHFDQKVETVEDGADGRLVVTTSAGTRITARAVIVAGGVGAFGPNRPPLAGLAEFEGKSVFYLVSKREDFRGKRVVIAGGGDSAVDWALSLAEVAEKIYVVHRRDKFRAAPENVDRMKALAADGKVEMVIPFQLAGLKGDAGVLSAVTVSALNGESRDLPADRLLPFFGLATNLGPIGEWNLELDTQRIQVAPESMASSRDGIYAIGDIAHYPGKLKLILTGFAEAARAAHSAHGRVHPGEALHFEYSTSRGVPGA
jgi:thioredoxin reductase (NADPH)